MSEKLDSLQILRFIAIQFLKLYRFDQIEEEATLITHIYKPELIDTLLNSAKYFEKKYQGELPAMQELYPIDGLQSQQVSIAASPQKKKNSDINYTESNTSEKKEESESYPKEKQEAAQSEKKEVNPESEVSSPYQHLNYDSASTTSNFCSLEKAQI